jgi:hypothetical protein
MLWLLSLAVAQTVPVPPPAPTATEPILSEAKVDVRMLRQSRPFALGAAAAPLAFGVGQVTRLAFKAQVGDTNEGAGSAGGTTMVVAALVGPTGAIGWMQSVERSTRALEAQGLRPRRVPRVVALLAVLGAASAGVSALVQDPHAGEGSQPGTRFLTGIGIGAYAGALALPALQQRHNRRARIDAGWWGP